MLRLTAKVGPYYSTLLSKRALPVESSLPAIINLPAKSDLAAKSYLLTKIDLSTQSGLHTQRTFPLNVSFTHLETKPLKCPIPTHRWLVPLPDVPC